MNTLVASLRLSARPSLLQRLAAAWRTGRERRRLKRIERALPVLNEATLRDLGLARGELLSCWAEAEGLVESTRLRVLQRLDHRLGL